MGVTAGVMTKCCGPSQRPSVQGSPPANTNSQQGSPSPMLGLGRSHGSPGVKQGGLLATARDWQLKVDLGRQLKFPENIAVTTLRPDMVLVSETTRQVVLLELTVPWEDRMEEAFERKRAKYEELAGECQNRGWRTRCNPIEGRVQRIRRPFPHQGTQDVRSERTAQQKSHQKHH